MLLTCALQEGGFIVNQAPPQLIREKSYTVGQSYDTASGRVVTMTMTDGSSDVTTTTASMEMGRQVRIIPLSTTDHVIAGGPLITIRKVKMPTSPPSAVCGIKSDIIFRDGHRGGKASGISTLTPVLPPKSPFKELRLSPASARGHLSGRMSHKLLPLYPDTISLFALLL